MRAVWYDTTGPASVLQYGELPDPVPGPGEVRVRIHASGINPSDVKTRSGIRGPIAFARVIPHSDGAGVIDAIGPGVEGRRVGERVWIWNGAWRRAFGTCSELVCIPSVQAAPLPESCSFEAGACLGIPASTACHAVFSDGPVKGQTILVTGGAGAVGHYAIQLARWGGARVIATASGPEKAARALAAGADLCFNYRTEDVAMAVRGATGDQGVDRIVEVEFGGNLAVSNAILKPMGTIATYGSMADPSPALPFYPMMFNGTTLRMILIYLLQAGARQEVVQTLARAMDEGVLDHAIAARYPLEQTAEAHLAVESGTLVGNVVVTFAR